MQVNSATGVFAADAEAAAIKVIRKGGSKSEEKYLGYRF